MPRISQTLLERARITVQRALCRGEPADHLIPLAVQGGHLYLSCDAGKVVGNEAVTLDGTTFYLGVRR